MSLPCFFYPLFIICFLCSAKVSFAQLHEVPDSLHFFNYLQTKATSADGFIHIHQDHRLENLFYKNLLSNADKKSMPGYRIQIYSGSGSNARTEALRMQNNFFNLFPNIPVNLVYEEPYFKLRVGNYRSKSEGFKEFKMISEVYPQCYFIIEKDMSFPEIRTSRLSVSDR